MCIRDRNKRAAWCRAIEWRFGMAEENALKPYEGQIGEISVLPSPSEYQMSANLAQEIAGSDFVPEGLRGKPAAVLACVLAGRELGVGAFQSLQKIHIIKGKPALSAELMRALVLKAGHRIWLKESTDDKVIICGQRKGEE